MECVIMGDSISEGIGSKHINYMNDLQRFTNNRYQFSNLAKTGTTIEYAKKQIEYVLNSKPDCVIIMYGSVDAQIRANIRRNRFGICSLIPKRYKIGGMLEPRAFYSKKWYRFLPDRIDNFFRKILKQLVLITQGKVQWVSYETFKRDYTELLNGLSSIQKVILVSTVFLDDTYFLGSNAEYEKYNAVIRELSEKFNCKYVDVFSELQDCVKKYGWEKYYSRDHFHPNSEGYEFIAKKISQFM